MAKKADPKVDVWTADNFLDMVTDCVARARHGIRSSNWQYVAEQIGKASYYLGEAGFHVDVKALVALHDKELHLEKPEKKKDEPKKE